MITAVDTTVLIDVFAADKTFGPRSREALREALADGALIACEVVWAEVAASFPTGTHFDQAVSRLGITYTALDSAAAEHAGKAWRAYRAAGGRRERVIADFLIGAHARTHADRLLSRDRGFYRRYFKGLVVVDPSTD